MLQPVKPQSHAAYHTGRGPHVGHEMVRIRLEGDGAARLSFTQQHPGNDEIDGGGVTETPSPSPSWSISLGWSRRLIAALIIPYRRAQDRMPSVTLAKYSALLWP